MTKVEKDFQNKFTPWAKKNFDKLIPCGYELKFINLTRKKSLALSDFRPQQLPALRKTAFHHKLSDAVFSTKPYDGFIAKAGFIGTMFFHPVTNPMKEFYWTNITDFDKFMSTHPRKSIREPELASISKKYKL